MKFSDFNFLFYICDMNLILSDLLTLHFYPGLIWVNFGFQTSGSLSGEFDSGPACRITEIGHWTPRKLAQWASTDEFN